MRIVLQRVSKACVRVDGSVVGAIGRGLLVLVGAATDDQDLTADAAAAKLAQLRVFEDESGRTNLSATEVGAAFLVVSQFTLLGSIARGRRPSFTEAARPELAARLVDRLVAQLAQRGFVVASGVFGATMEVELVNDGPFTLVVDVDSMGKVAG